ncbi:hypothetical protein BCAH1134_C0459 (plasmid) [Bacillus cereus AH1134]|nr:hypothetical protein BCAH1134_C0459 [Bacillus cereus AH1134]
MLSFRNIFHSNYMLMNYYSCFYYKITIDFNYLIVKRYLFNNKL